VIPRQDQRILLTGTNGQVGFELARSLQGLGKVIAPLRVDLDISNLDQIRRFVREIKPTLIVNPAAFTAVDQAESENALALRINAEAPGVLAEEAKRLGVPLIHFSTDYVFDGTKPDGYVETDATAPLNIYGSSKLAGEQAVAQVGGMSLIFRTSWVYGRRGKNFFLTMLRLAKERDLLRVVGDQHGAPTWSRTIAELVGQVISQGYRRGRADQYREDDWWQSIAGVYHLTSQGQTTWAGFAKAIFELNKLTVPTVESIPSSEYPAPAKRPVYSVLSGQKFNETFGLSAPDWREALSLCVAEHLSC
jgi:dTDP-4-dehydrorhamnose reductase